MSIIQVVDEVCRTGGRNLFLHLLTFNFAKYYAKWLAFIGYRIDNGKIYLEETYAGLTEVFSNAIEETNTMNLADMDHCFDGCTVIAPKQCEHCKYRNRSPYIDEDGETEVDYGWRKAVCLMFNGKNGYYKPISIMDDEVICPFRIIEID